MVSDSVEHIDLPLNVCGYEIVPHPARSHSIFSITEEQFPGASKQIRHEVIDVISEIYGDSFGKEARQHEADAPMDLIILNQATPEKEITCVLDDLRALTEFLHPSLGVIVVGVRKNTLPPKDEQSPPHLRPLSPQESVCGFYVAYLQPLEVQDLTKAKDIMTDLINGAIKRHVATNLG